MAQEKVLAGTPANQVPVYAALVEVFLVLAPSVVASAVARGVKVQVSDGFLVLADSLALGIATLKEQEEALAETPVQ